MLAKLLLLVKCLLLLLSNFYLVDSSRNISMTKCCHDGTFYVQGFDSCDNDSGHSFLWPRPFVYSEDFHPIDDTTDDDFKIIVKKEDCPQDQIAISTTKFKFLVDGSLRLMEDGRNFQVGQFCLSQVFRSDEEIIARFCTPDPCIEANTGSAGCIRKCCPIGMELSSATFTCQPSSSTDVFDVQFRNELDESVDRNLSSYVIRYGVTPKCTHGFNAPGKSFDNDEPFYILLDARMYVPAYLYNHRFVSDYCVDMERSNGSDVVNQIV